MKKNFKYLNLFAAALMLSLGLGSCSSDDESTPMPNGKFDTSFRLALSNPATYGASAEDQNATSYELSFETVDVFVFSVDGTLESHTQRKAADFDRIAGTDKWELKSGKSIGAMTGDKLIYVGLNLPADIAANIKKNGPSSSNAIVAITDLERAEGISMFNREVVKETLVEDTSGAKNVVTVPVSRLLAKVLFFEKTANRVYDVKETGAKASDVHFAVGNVNNEFFPLPDLVGNTDPNFTNDDMSARFLQPGINLDSYQPINLKGTSVKDGKSVYATENTITDGLVVQGAATYGIVRVVYTPAKTVSLTNPSDGNSTLKENLNPVKGKTFHLVRTLNPLNNQMIDLLFENLDEAKAYAAAKNGNPDDICTYTDGLAYYPVFLKDVAKAGASKYSIYRNTAYQVTINDIHGLGSHTDQPNEKPKGIIDPKDPIDQETSVDVDIVINDWVMASPQDEDLIGR